ncbi:hypothetical protein AAVH_05414 [Aphelenchoides avenae]|nr:hypothetical protein AAVH_05414 [Aphelenchus avenae]
MFTDAWEQRHGVNIHVSALINGYGEGRSVTKFVAETLADRVINAPDLESILTSSGVQGASLVKDTAIDDQIHTALKNIFLRLDNEFYEATLKPLLESEKDGIDVEKGEAAAHLFDSTGGRSVILALLVDERLYVAHCGNSAGVICKDIGGELVAFQVSEVHEMMRNEKDPGCSTPPSRCFGDYKRKMEVNAKGHQLTAEPIKLNETFRFLIFVSATAASIVTRKYGDEANGNLAMMVADELHKPHEECLRSVLSSIAQQTSSPRERTPLVQPTLSALLMDLENDIPSEPSGKEAEPEASTAAASADGLADSMVESVVDWSEFDTHELRDTVMAKIESLTQHFRDRKVLPSIAEH